MRKLIAAILASVSLNAAAINGPIDGIYTCRLSAGNQSVETYLTVNGKPDGWTVWAIPALSPNQFFYGYGVGYAIGNAFRGVTMFNLPFDVAIDTAPTGHPHLQGTVGIMVDSVAYTASVDCNLFY